MLLNNQNYIFTEHFSRLSCLIVVKFTCSTNKFIELEA